MYDIRNDRFDAQHDGLSYRQYDLAALQARELPADVILTAVKDRLKTQIDVRAEAIRSSVVTPGAGQAMEYQEAQTQAAAALKAPSSATAEKYPMLAASIGVDVDPGTGALAEDVLGVARAVMAAYQAWQGIGSEIRRVRLAGKAAIDTATTIEEVTAAFDALAWPNLAG